MNKKFDISNVRYELISSSHPGYKEVQVLFTHQGKEEKHFIFIKDEGKKNYVKEAKKIFKQDLKSGKVVQALKVTPGGKHPILITSIAVVGVAAIAVAGFFTYKYLNNPEPTPTPAVSHKFTFNGEHCRINGSLEYTHDILESDKNVQYTIVADQEWKLPDTIACTDVAYNKDTGVITISEITKDITVNVSALANPTPGAMFTVSFDANGGEVTSPNPVTVETFHTIENPPTLADRAGYDKEEVVWKDKDNRSFTFGPEGTGTPVTENMILKANWGAIQTFTVHFHETDTITTDVEVNYGDKPVFYTPQGEEGDTFLGWFKGPEDAADEFPFDEPITAEANAYAHWREPGYVVMWVNHDGTILETDTGLKQGETPEYHGDMPAPYVEDSYLYKFIGWSPDVGPIDGDRLYIAQFTGEMIEGVVLMSFNIPTGGETVSLAFATNGELKFDWGDDETETIQPGQEEIEHSYAEGGKYVLIITGNITSIDIIPSDYYDYTEILTSLYLGETISSLPPFALTGFSSLETITVDPNNSTYDSRDNCNAIIETATNTLVVGCKGTVIPNSVATIGMSAFGGCSGLININIPESVLTIENYAFEGCSGLTNIIITNVRSIGIDAFEGCSSLTNINIPKSVLVIGLSPFMNCSSLETITVADDNPVYDSRNNCNAIITKEGNTLVVGCKGTVIPNSVATIGMGAFAGCLGLININIPESVTSINDNAFTNCSSLETITVDQNNSTYDSRDDCNAIITKGDNTLVVGCKGTVIPNSVTAIGDGAFAGCLGLININIPESVTSIGDESFYGCSNLETITVDQNNSTYDSRDDCNAIITKGDNTLVVGCKGTVIPNSVTAIGDSAFRARLGRTAINIPATVTNIGNSAFRDNLDLISATISNGTIGRYAFAECLNLSYVKISSGVDSIDLGSFRGCSNLSVVDLTEFSENNIPDCGSQSFQSCSSDLKFYVAPGMRDKFMATEGWDDYDPSYFVETDVPPTPPVC